MNDVIHHKEQVSYPFVFTGKGLDYFLICLLNIFLVCITLGIYTPWAVIRGRRYIYQHMELKGQPFAYKATGSALFFSFLFILVIYILSVVCFVHQHFMLGGIIFGLFFLAIPFMMVKSLQYQASMTSLNGIRFGFSCSMLRAWLIIFALPIALEIGLCLIIWGIFSMMGEASSPTDAIIRLAIMGIAVLIGLGVINGVFYGKWMELVGKGTRFGIHTFSIQVNIKQCIKGCVLSMLSLVPFVVVIIYIAGPIWAQVTILGLTGQEEAKNQLILENIFLISASYILYIFAFVVMASYLYVTLRNQFFNNLKLANGTLQFHSSVTGVGMIIRIVMVAVLSGITCGIAYPWLKMYLIGWLASHTQVSGDLDNLELANADMPEERGLLLWLSRGIAPYVPFI